MGCRYPGRPRDPRRHGQQRELFKQKFGREPGPADPVFFDPDADEPRPLRPESFLAELADLAAEAGVDPAFIQASRELGYMVTDENRHMFSAEETAAWRDAVLRHRGQEDIDDADDGDPFDGDDGADSMFEQLADGVEILVAELLRETDPEVVPRFLDAVVAPFDDEEAQQVTSLVAAVLLAWITGAREHGLRPAGPDGVLTWIRTNLGEHAETTAGALGGLLGHPTAPDVTLDEAVTQMGEDFVAGLVWLATGVAATTGGGDAHWFRRFDPDDPAGPTATRR